MHLNSNSSTWKFDELGIPFIGAEAIHPNKPELSAHALLTPAVCCANSCRTIFLHYRIHICLHSGGATNKGHRTRRTVKFISELAPILNWFQAPASMKAVIQSLWLLTIGLGSSLVIVITSLDCFDRPVSS